VTFKCRQTKCRQTGKRRQLGFTLVEVMVAMMIVGLALPALLGQTASLSRHTFAARAKTQAFWVAQNKLAEVSIERRLTGAMPSRKETDTVELGRNTWSWILITEETALENMYRVEVEVGINGQEGTLAWLSGFIQGE
jgi:general secretion pathway protein I